MQDLQGSQFPVSQQRVKTAFMSMMASHHDDIMPWIKFNLKKYNLFGDFEPFDVLNETYLRIWEYVDKGKEINNMFTFTKIVSLRVVQELSRSKNTRRKRFLNHNSIELQTALIDIYLEEDLEAEHSRMQEAFALLSENQQKLMRFRVIEGLPWREVNSALVSQGQISNTDATLRKQGQRVREKLRANYNSIH